MVYRAPNTFLSERNLSLNGIDVRYPASSISHFDEIAAKSKSSNGYADKAQEKDNSEPKTPPLEMVKVPPVISSMVSLPSRALRP